MILLGLYNNNKILSNEKTEVWKKGLLKATVV